MRRLALVLLLLLGSLPASARPDPVQLTVEVAVRLALARNPRISAALARLEAAREEAEIAASPARPQARITAWREQIKSPLGPPITANTGPFTGISFQSDPVVYGDTRAEVELRQLLFDGGRVEARIAEARASAGRVEQDLARAGLDLRLEVERAFLEALEARSRRELVREAEDLARDQLRLAEARFEAGSAARADVVFARVPVAQAELERVRALQRAETTEASLNRLLGLPLDTPLELEEPSPQPSVESMEEAMAQAGVRAEVRAAEAALEAARHGVRAAETENAAQVHAVAALNGIGYNDEVLPENDGWRVALELNWTPFDGNRSVHMAARARAAVREAEALLEDARQQVQLEVVQAWRGLATAQEELDSARVEEERAAEALAMARGRYETGVAPFLEVSEAQVDLVEARTRVLVARYTVSRAVFELSRAVGEGPYGSSHSSNGTRLGGPAANQ